MTYVDGERSVKTYSGALSYLADALIQSMPKNVDYRIVSKNMILRFEFNDDVNHVATFTNIESKKHQWVIRKVIDVIDQIEMDDGCEDTELDD